MNTLDQLVAGVVASLLLIVPISFAIEFKQDAEAATALAEKYQAKLDAALLDLGLEPSEPVTDAEVCRAATTEITGDAAPQP